MTEHHLYTLVYRHIVTDHSIAIITQIYTIIHTYIIFPTYVVSSSSDQALNSLRSQMLTLLETSDVAVVFATNLIENIE